MGISVSSTRTHERLLEKRAIRKMKRYQSNDANKMGASPVWNYEHNDVKKSAGHQTSKLYQINNIQNLEITLKIKDKKNKDYQKLPSPRDEPYQMFLKKDSIRQTQKLQINQELSIKPSMVVDNKVLGHPSMQEIHLLSNRASQQLQINPQPEPISFQSMNSNKQVGSVSQRNISHQKELYGNENEEIEKGMQKEMEKNKIEQTKRYIDSSPYPSKGQSSNTIYQQKSNTKIESILSQQNSSPIWPSKNSETKEIPEVTTIKLKTEEEYIDQVKQPDRATRGSLMMRKKSGRISGNSSLSSLKKKM